MTLAEILSELKDIPNYFTVSVGVSSGLGETNKFVHLKRMESGVGFKPNQRANKLYDREVEFTILKPPTQYVFLAEQ